MTDERPEKIIVLTPRQADGPSLQSMVPSENDARPLIRLHPGVLTRQAEQFENAILTAGLPVYVGAAGLVYPAERNVETAENVFTTMTQLVSITMPIMLQMMDVAARVEKFDRRMNKWVPAKPPRDIAELILARRGFWPFFEVIGVINAPTIGMNGEVVSNPGLDRRSKLLLSGAPTVVMADQPTRQDAERALETLEELLREYQFADKPSRAVALSMLITPLVRALLPLAPLHCVSAPVAGSGKSYLASLASAVATGHYCPVIPPAEKKEEFEKRLVGALLSGMPIISFDNVTGILDDGTLCQALEQRVIEVRPLGTSKLFTVEQRTNWFANGNNIEISQDLTRRSLMSRIDRNEERPELHEYSRRPYEQVMMNRGKYIAAALTIVRAYILAGRPNKLLPLASYEEWSDNVRSALCWLDCADCCDSMISVREGDSRLQKLQTLLSAWAFVLGLSTELSARDIVRIAEDRKANGGIELGQPSNASESDLWEAIFDCCGFRDKIDATGLGNFLKTVVDRVVSIDDGTGRQIRLKVKKGVKPDRSKAAMWLLKEV